MEEKPGLGWRMMMSVSQFIYVFDLAHDVICCVCENLWIL